MADLPSTCLCSECSGLCCRYFALPIDNPDEARDYDNIRWYLLHENVTIFVEKSQWYIGIANRCKQLQPDNRCGVYETRPRVCRGYSTDNCDYHGGEYEFEMLFTSADQLERYAKQKLAEDLLEKRQKASRKAKRKAMAERQPVNLMELAEKLKKNVSANANSRPPGPPQGATNGAVNGNGKRNGDRKVSLPLL